MLSTVPGAFYHIYICTYMCAQPFTTQSICRVSMLRLLRGVWARLSSSAHVLKFLYTHILAYCCQHSISTHSPQFIIQTSGFLFLFKRLATSPSHCTQRPIRGKWAEKHSQLGKHCTSGRGEHDWGSEPEVTRVWTLSILDEQSRPEELKQKFVCQLEKERAERTRKGREQSITNPNGTEDQVHLDEVTFDLKDL